MGFQMTQPSTPLSDGANGVLMDHLLFSLTTTPSGLLNLASGVSGSGAACALIANPDVSTIGTINCTTGTATTGRSGVGTAGGTIIRPGGGVMACDWRFQMPTLLDGTEQGAIYIGFGDSISAAPVDGAYLYWDNSQTNFRYRTRNNSTESDADSGLAPVAATWYVVRITFNAAGTSVNFKIGAPGIANLANSQDIATNIPTASGRETAIVAYIIKSAGITARSLYLDYVRLAWSGFSA